MEEIVAGIKRRDGHLDKTAGAENKEWTSRTVKGEEGKGVKGKPATQRTPEPGQSAGGEEQSGPSFP